MSSSRKKPWCATHEVVPLDDICTEYEPQRLLVDENGEHRQGTGRNASKHAQRPSLLRAVTRAFKIKILSMLVLRRHPREPPKVAVSKSFLVAFLEGMVHVPPLAFTLALIHMNCSGYFIGQKKVWWMLAAPLVSKFLGQSYRSVSLAPFIAKTHEFLMQLSIAMILQGLVSRQARTGYTSFGLLFAPNRVTDIAYLWSLEFWSSFRSPALPLRHRLPTIFVVLCCVLLASLVGPFSTAVMTPRPVVRPVSSSAELRLPDTPSVLFPSGIYNEYRNEISGDYLLKLARLRVAKGTNPMTWNLTVTEDPGKFSRSLDLSMTVEDLDHPESLAVIPTYEISDSFQRLSESGFLSDSSPDNPINFNAITVGVESYHPSISVRCLREEWTGITDRSSWIQIPQRRSNDFQNLVIIDDLVGSVLANDNLTNRSTHWTNVPTESPYSLAVVILEVLGTTESNLSLGNALKNSSLSVWNETTLGISACGIEASWHKGMFQCQPTTAIPNIGLLSSAKSYSQQSSSKIHIDKAWAEDLFHLVDKPDYGWYSMRPLNRSTLGDANQPGSTEVALAAVFAHGLSNIKTNDAEHNLTCDAHDISDFGNCNKDSSAPVPQVPCPADFDLSNKNCSTLRATFQEPGYGYSISISDTPMILSLVVLCGYCAIVILCLLWSLITRTTCTAWEAPSELVALALQSQIPDHLGYTSVGLEKMATYKEAVGIRVNENEKLELIFKDDGRQQNRQLRIIEANKEY